MTGFGTRREHGAVLVVSLVFLIVMAVISLTSIQTSKLELRMAGNEVVRENSHQMAQALIDTIVSMPASTPVIGGIGFTLCTAGQPNCNLPSIVGQAGPVNDQINAGNLSATAPLTSIGPPLPGLGFSADVFIANHYRVTSTYDRADEGLGRSTVTQGLVVLTTTAN